MRKILASLGLAPLAALLLSFSATAQVQCEGAACGGALSSSSLAQDAIDCLCTATGFFDKDARDIVNTSTGSTTFETILPLSYDSVDYNDAAVEEALNWARQAPRTPDKDEVLYEAALRYASAHAMFGDDGLLRGLNASYDPGSGSPIQIAFERLDSRECRIPGGAFSGVLCNTKRDCAPTEVCEARRLGAGAANEIFGAVQEYRRAETALANAIHAVGVSTFADLDRSQSATCGGGGCAARLLVRIGAMKARAQSERVDLLWRRAIATGGVPDNAPVCSAGEIGQTCSLDRDCDTDMPPALGVCGDPSKPVEGNFVFLREVASEYLAEGAVAQAFYASALNSKALDSIDAVLMQGALRDVAEAEGRSANGLTPFGIPDDYVPLIAQTNLGLMNCLQSCPDGSSCAATQVFQCLVTLAEGTGFLTTLDQAAASQSMATYSFGQFVDATRERATFEINQKNEYRRILDRMFGPPCSLGTCACATEEAERGECVNFDGDFWIVEGIRCDDPTDPYAQCDTAGADGEIERQIQQVRNAELALSNFEERFRRNAESRVQTVASYTAIAGIRAEECQGVEATIQAGNQAISDAYNERESNLGGSTGSNVVGAVLGGVSAISSIGSVIGPTSGFAALGAAGPYGIAIAGAVGVLGSVFGGNDKETQQIESLRLEKKISQVRAQQEIDIQRVKCDAQGRILQVNVDDALFQVATERQNLQLAALEQRGLVLDALIVSQQLIAEIRQARERYEEAQEFTQIWDGTDFRNPQNYRTVALTQQLAATDEFRTAQILTWLILRAAAYDLARPDFAVPQNFTPNDSSTVLTIDACRQSACSVSGDACATDADCEGAEICALEADDAGVADSNGSCSLQAVFAARTVDDLRSLIRSAYRAQVATQRTLACSQAAGDCTKTLSLRDIFTDVSSGDQRPALGDLLLSGPITGDNEAILEFGLTLKRGFRLCPSLPGGDFLCEPEGVAGLLPDPPDNAPITDTNAQNVWNARLLAVKGRVKYDPAQNPLSTLCRDPSTGVVVDDDPFICFNAIQGDPCGAGATCRQLMSGNLEVQLHQVGVGLVRTSFADTASPNSEDSFLRYRMRFARTVPGLGQSPSFENFSITGLFLPENIGAAAERDEIRGVPVASPRWQLRVKDTNLLEPNDPEDFEAVLQAIEDIELVFRYQGFDL